jgi:DNA-binding response OmpR family regulator
MGTGSVLLIEDEQDIADMLRMSIEREGFVLDHASTGEVGLEHLRQHVPRAVLLDLGLPGLDGVEVCRRIRESSDVPIIMLTARDSEVDTVVGLEVGADDYVTKPFSPKEVVARINAILRRVESKPQQTSAVTVSGHTVDGGRREVRTPAGDTVRPTAREFDLLWYLASARGIVLTRAQIVESVWGYDYFGDPRTVDVHIRQLRRKLPDLAIETVWGVGYRIDA